MAPFALVFHPRNDGYRPMPMTPSCAWYKTLHWILLQSPTRPYLRSITIIAHCCPNPSSLLREICLFYVSPLAERLLLHVCSWHPLSSSISSLLPSIPIPSAGIWTHTRPFIAFNYGSMYAYVKRMCQACPGCALANLTRGKSSELVYNFPIEAPFLVMFFNAYSAGKHTECYLIGCCRMCSFACMEPISSASATTIASAIMKVLLHYMFCFTIVLDKDSKFFGVCREAIDLLQINCHALSSTNHNPMIIKRINRYLTKGLKIMCN